MNFLIFTLDNVPSGYDDPSPKRPISTPNGYKYS